MIEIFISKTSPDVGFVWNVQDVFTLREDHRIVGSLSGCLPRAPRQENFLGVPLLLSGEEIDLLVSEGFAKTVSIPILSELPTREVQDAFNKYRETSYKDQIEVYRELRKREIVRMSDQIVDGKRRKLQTDKNVEQEKTPKVKNTEIIPPTSDEPELKNSEKRESSVSNEETITSEDSALQKSEEEIEIVEDEEKKLESREEILEQEFRKIKDIPRHQQIMQIFNSHPWIKDEDKVPFEWKPAANQRDEIRRLTFRTLWSCGFYITSGEKFGGDFLVYPGEPCMFHARYVVVCSSEEELSGLTERDLVCRSRLGTAVKKTVLMATKLRNSKNEIEFNALKRINEKRKKRN